VRAAQFANVGGRKQSTRLVTEFQALTERSWSYLDGSQCQTIISAPNRIIRRSCAFRIAKAGLCGRNLKDSRMLKVSRPTRSARRVEGGATQEQSWNKSYGRREALRMT